MTTPSPVLADPIQIPVLRGQPPTQVCPRVGGSVLIYNPDLTNVVNVGYRNNIGLSNSLPVQPLGSATLDGSRSIYAFLPQSATIDSVILCVAPGGTNISPSPAQISAQVAALGLATESTLAQVNGHAIGIAVNTQDTVTTLGSPAQDGTVNAVNTTLGSPAQDGTVHLVNTTLGTPAQNGTVSGLNTGIPNGIAATGAPLLALATIFSNPGVQTFTAGQTRQYGPASFGQISYEIFFSCISNAAETNPQFIIELDWINSATGVVVSAERHYMCGGISPAANNYVGTGRAKGDTLRLTVTYNGTLASGNCQIVITQSSRVYTRDDFRSTSFNGFPGVPNAGYDVDANVLMETGPTIAAGAQIQRSMPLYAGTVRLTAFTQTGTGNVFIGTQDTSLTNNTVFQQNIPANGFIDPQFDLPRKQCIMTVTNTGSGSQQIGVAVYLSEQNI